MQKEITISMEEYKELLIIKGKYEELKENQKPKITYEGIRYNDTGVIETPLKLTCQNKELNKHE